MPTLTIAQIRAEVTDPDHILVDRNGLSHMDVRVAGRRVGDLYYRRAHRAQPEWLRFFTGAIDASNATVNLSTASLAAVLLTKEKEWLYAILFGFGRTLLHDGVVEPRFGLRATLNGVEPSKLRSIDHKRLEAISRNTREQLSRAAGLGQFGLDVDRDLLRAVTGTPADPRYGRRLSGADHLTVSCDVTIEQLGDYLEMYRQLAERKDYAQNFPWVDNVREVRDSTLRTRLEKRLTNDMARQSGDAWLAPPGIIDWVNTVGFRYSPRKRATVYADLDIRDYYAECGSAHDLTDGRLTQDRIYHVRAEDDAICQSWPVVRCLVAECEYLGRRYVLNEGVWYEIDRDFLAEVEQFCSEIPNSSLAFPPYKSKTEGAYNKKVAQKVQDCCLLDQKFINYPGRGKVEVCDIFTRSKVFVHVKRYGASSTLSHLFAQGSVSAHLMVGEPKFRYEFQQRIPEEYRWGDPKDPIPPRDFEICFAIICRAGKGLTLPFFSKVSLRTVTKSLRQMGYRVTIAAIAS